MTVYFENHSQQSVDYESMFRKPKWEHTEEVLINYRVKFRLCTERITFLVLHLDYHQNQLQQFQSIASTLVQSCCDYSNKVAKTPSEGPTWLTFICHNQTTFGGLFRSALIRRFPPFSRTHCRLLGLRFHHCPRSPLILLRKSDHSLSTN